MSDNKSNLKIITDNKWKQFKYRNEVPEKILNNYFEHLPKDEYIDGFIKYKKMWYHTSEFMRLEHGAPDEFKDYICYSYDSFISGVLIKISDDGECYKIATYL